MATRTTKTARIEDVTVKTQTAQAAEQAVPQTESEESIFATLRSMAEMCGVQIPTGRQLMLGFAVQVLVGVVGGYAAVQLCAYVAVGAMLLSGSAFIAVLLQVLVGAIAVYATMIAASRAALYVTGGKLEEHAKAVKNFAARLFQRREVRHA